MAIINADDFGMGEEVNDAIVYCFENKLINQTTILMNGKYCQEAFLLSDQYRFRDKVGLHINLVSGTPLTQEIRNTFLCTDGEFNGSLMKGRNRIYMNKTVRRTVEREIEAQVMAYLDMGFQLKHVDSHRHSHTNLSVINILLKIMRKYDFDSIRLAKNIPYSGINLRAFYKMLLNKKIRRFNSNGKYNDIVYFGSLDDYEESLVEKKRVEIMVHPVIRTNEIKDNVSGRLLEERLKGI